jgi:hypothetical protein
MLVWDPAAVALLSTGEHLHVHHLKSDRGNLFNSRNHTSRVYSLPVLENHDPPVTTLGRCKE